MLDNQTVLIFLYAGIVIFSFVAILDVLIQFKRPIVLKTFLLIMVGCVGTNAVGVIYSQYYHYSRILTELPLQIYALFYINFIYHLYANKYSKIVFVSCVLILIVMLTLPYYFQVQYGLDLFTTNFYNHPKSKDLITIVRIVILIYCFALSIFILIKMIERFHQFNIYYIKLRDWCKYNIILMILGLTAGILKYTFPDLFLFKFISVLAILTHLILIIYRPSFLNKLPASLSLLNVFTNTKVDKISVDSFTHLFFNNMYFLNEKANTADFSKELDVSQDILIAFVKKTYNVSFIELVNKQRILYFVELAKKPESKLITIEALAKQSGFSSRQNMSKFFAKYHGGAPSDLLNM
jgi:AraC-like DNA-binding protein